MRLTPDQARERLESDVHGVLCTLHRERGPAPEPVVFVVTGEGHVGVPIDRVKPKSASRLAREANLAVDPRAALLVERWDPTDWSALWWVRADLRHVEQPSAGIVEELADALARRVPQYADRPFHRIVVCRIVGITGWAARGEG